MKDANGQTAVVIGGGIAGLASAALLAREGLKVTVLEQRAELGGRAGSWELNGFRFDTGPSWYLMPEVFDHFFRLMGTTAHEQLDLVKLDPGYRVFFQGNPESVDIVADRTANMATFERLEPGAGAALDKHLVSARETYEIALRRFLYSTFASFLPLLVCEVLSKVSRLGRLLLQSLEDFVGRSFSDNRLRQILGYPAVFLGSAPSMTPSMYHLMSHLDMEDGVYYPQGGFSTIIDSIARLAEQHGVRIEAGVEVTGITVRREGAAKVSGVDLVDASGAGHHLPADVVVSTADLNHTETVLVPEDLRSYPERWWKRRVSGPGAVLVYLGVRGRIPELAHHTLFFTEDWTENFDAIFREPTRVPDPASLYVCRPSATDDSVAPEGQENLFVLVPVPADVAIGAGGLDGAGDPRVEAAADAAIRQIANWASIPDLAERVVLRRTVGPEDFENEFHSWKGSALGPAHTLRQSAFLRGKNVSSKIDGLLYAGGTTVPGIGLPMCLISAELVIKRLRGDNGTSALIEHVRERQGVAR